MKLKEKALRALDYATNNPYLKRRFKKKFPNNTTQQVASALEANLLDDQKMSKIASIAPTCYVINGNLFLEGEIKGEYDFIGDGMDYQKAIELYDISTEMLTGNSHTFYTSTTKFFKVANATQTAKVMEFLDKL